MPTLGAQVVQGCFSSSGDLVSNGTVQWNSKSGCAHDICFVDNFTVAGTTGGNQCFCGNHYPSENDRVDDSKCNVGCSGYGLQACMWEIFDQKPLLGIQLTRMVGGGIGFWTIYNTGVSLAVEAVDGPGSSSSSSATTKPTAVVTVSGSQVTVTATDAAPSQGSSSNVAGIAAGTVVGIVAISGLVGAAFFFIRRRRNREIEEEHRRNAAVNAFINGSKPPGSSSGSMSFSDARLDPVISQRRMSDGSIADNEDYSRRILRVCFFPYPWGLVLLPDRHQS